jgi:trk system potassium uptake protein TrkA
VKIVIVGCGRVGASLATLYDSAGHDVVVVDSSTAAFDRLPSTFGGTAIRGDGTDEDVLRRSGAEGADIFLALTEGDNRNIMASQLAVEALSVDRVVAKINDPLRAKAYAELGIATLCRTGLMVDAVDRYLGFEPSGLPGMLAPTGQHADHHDPEAAMPGGGGAGAEADRAAPLGTRSAHSAGAVHVGQGFGSAATDGISNDRRATVPTAGPTNNQEA